MEDEELSIEDLKFRLPTEGKSELLKISKQNRDAYQKQIR